jgi:sigma-B regulation protein RsbU (phosphoserine phosphatase)
MTDSLLPNLELAPCGLLTCTDTGIVLGVNKTLVHLLGFNEKDDFTGKNIEAFFTLATRIFSQTHFFPMLLLQGKAGEIFLTLKRKDGGSLPVICNAVVVTEQAIRICHCVFFPIEERAKYEQELLGARKLAEASQKENKELIAATEELERFRVRLDQQIHHLSQVTVDMSEFSKVASHDLQEPIRKIAVWADRMVKEQSLEAADPIGKGLRAIHKECVRLRTLTINLEKYISLHNPAENVIEIDLNNLIAHEFTSAKDRASCPTADLVCPKLPFIEGYVSQIRLLFSALFDNFFRFHESKLPLTIAVTAHVEKRNSYQSLKGQFRYIDALRMTIASNSHETRTDTGFMYLMNKKETIQSTELEFGFASCRKIISNHFGEILAVTGAANSTAVIIDFPLKHSIG